MPWDITQPTDNYIVAQFPALNRSDKTQINNRLDAIIPDNAPARVRNAQNAVWVVYNADFDGTNWNRLDTTKPARAERFNADGSVDWLFADAGANPITWTVHKTLTAGGVLNSIVTADIADGSVTTTKIADLNVTTGKLADQSVTTAKIADLNVTTTKIADLGVTTGKIADNAVTDAKLAPGNKLADLDNRFVNVTGDTMTGSLTAPWYVANAGDSSGFVGRLSSSQTQSLIELIAGGRGADDKRWVLNSAGSFQLFATNDAGNVTQSILSLSRNNVLTVGGLPINLYQIAVDATTVTVSNTTSETSLFSTTITGGTLGTTGTIEFIMPVTLANGQSLSQSFNFNFKYGTSTASVTLNVGASSTVHTIITGYIFAQNATNSQWLMIMAYPFSSTVGTTASSLDSTVNQTLNVTITMGTGATNITTTKRHARLLLYK